MVDARSVSVKAARAWSRAGARQPRHEEIAGDRSSVSTALGLWSFRSIRFSLRCTLLSTAEHFVPKSTSGLLIEEPGAATTGALRKLRHQARLTRAKLGARSYRFTLFRPGSAIPSRIGSTLERLETRTI